MKIYRCFLACLLVFFISIGVVFIYSYVSERRSEDKGILILEQRSEELGAMRGAGGNVTGYGVC